MLLVSESTIWFRNISKMALTGQKWSLKTIKIVSIFLKRFPAYSENFPILFFLFLNCHEFFHSLREHFQTLINVCHALDWILILCCFLQKPLGLLTLLDEESTFPNGTDMTFAAKLKQHLKSNSCFRGERGKAFTVHHYAGEVSTYTHIPLQ